MPIYRLTLAYDGTDFFGWQRQPAVVTVQEVVESALESIVGEPVRIVGAGRTDRGVHARGQVAHLRLERPVDERALVAGTNHFLPETVRVMAARESPAGFHARRCALSKEYRYYLSSASVVSPLGGRFVQPVRGELDLKSMRQATRFLVGSHDFDAFATAGGAPGPTRRTIYRADWLVDNGRLVFVIEGEGFLRGMVRALVGTLLDVGRGRRTPQDMAVLLEGRTRSEAGPSAPARGLVLEAVRYDARWE